MLKIATCGLEVPCGVKFNKDFPVFTWHFCHNLLSYYGNLNNHQKLLMQKVNVSKIYVGLYHVRLLINNDVQQLYVLRVF